MKHVVRLMALLLFAGSPVSALSATDETVIADSRCLPSAAIRPGEQRYKVRAGETLSAIAGRSGTSVSCLMGRNRLARANQVNAGAALVIPAPEAPEPPVAKEVVQPVANAALGAVVPEPLSPDTAGGPLRWLQEQLSLLLLGLSPLLMSESSVGGVVALAALALFLFARAAHVARLRSRLREPLAGASTVDVAILSSGRGNATRELAIPLSLGATVYDVYKIDPDVLGEVLRSHSFDSVSDLPDLWRQMVRGAEMHEAGLAGLLNRYKGYYGESCIADALRADDHVVDMALTPNQEGWDALVDGTPVQFKAGLSSAAITEHLSQSPDIPVVTVSEHLDRFGDHDMVTVLPDVSGHDIEAATRTTLEGMMDVATLDTALDTLPWIAAGLRARKSSVRYVRGEIDGATAVEFLALDVTGPLLGGAAGGAVGAEAGEMIGDLLFDAGDAGRAIGKVIGAAAGVIGSGRLTQYYKERHLRRAAKDFHAAAGHYIDDYRDGLEMRAAAIDGRAEKLGGAGLRGWLWPTLNDVARTAIRKEESLASARCRDKAESIDRALNAAWASTGATKLSCGECGSDLSKIRCVFGRVEGDGEDSGGSAGATFLRGWCPKCRDHRVTMLREQIPEQFARSGLAALQGLEPEPVFTGRLGKLIRQVEESLRQIRVEQQKLGYGEQHRSKVAAPA